MIYSWSLSSEVITKEMGGLICQVDHAIALPEIVTFVLIYPEKVLR